MYDQRIEALAKTFIYYSCALKPGENVLIEANDESEVLARALVKEAYRAGATPYVWLRQSRLERLLIEGANQSQLELMKESDRAFMEKMDAYIGLRAGLNNAELSDVTPEKQAQYAAVYRRPVGAVRMNKKWCTTHFPTPAMAQMAGMSTDAFEDFYFKVCNVDYAKMRRAMEPLKELMEKTDEVHILGPGTDIRFSIKGLPAVCCAGDKNLPDGELFSAPVAGSINGVISYNTPSLFEGFVFENVKLTYKEGRLIDAQANDTERIRAIFDRDDGAKGVGEFSFGLNPYVEKPMKQIIFDEKISGSFHLTPGNCYEECDNGNKSGIHWDLVCIQTPEFGGGEIWFDGVLIRKDGEFVLPQLEGLNRSALMNS